MPFGIGGKKGEEAFDQIISIGQAKRLCVPFPQGPSPSVTVSSEVYSWGWGLWQNNPKEIVLVEFWSQSRKRKKVHILKPLLVLPQ